MKELIKPKMLCKGDTVTTVSLSWGGAGDSDLLWRYEVGKKRLIEQFGLNVVEMENTLKGSEYIYNNPEQRAKDLMDAFKDPNIKGIFSCIGGDDSIRLLPFIDFDVIRKNPKIFIGYSDTTITHLICLKAGLSSFYGASVLAELAENIKIFDYTGDNIKKVLFDNTIIGDVFASDEWTGERISWSIDNMNVSKKMFKNDGYKVLQGIGKISGRLIGGCIEVLEMAKGTIIWPDSEMFDNSILFLETSEEMPKPKSLKYWLRNYAAQGILNRVNAIIFGKPYQGKYYNEYIEVIKQVTKEFEIVDLPIIYNMSFGHNEPMCVLPYGAMATIDCDKKIFSIEESGVI